MNWIDKLEKRFGGLAIKNLALYLVAGQVIVFTLTNFERMPITALHLNPILIVKGEVWRLVTFMLIPPRAGLIFLAFAWYIFWMISQALEAQWGIFKYNLFILGGMFATYVVSIFFPYYLFDNYYIGVTVFLAFATLYPNFEFLLFFILPVKVKYLAWLSLGGLALAIIDNPWPVRVVIMATLANYALFFGKDLYQSFHHRQRRIEHQKKVQDMEDEAFHTCTTCGATDKTNPEREFRYKEGKGICSVCLEKEANSEV
ncbi:MAG: hypothetical protein O7C75_07125 [Verrucomicrobia bacterium]|nr:hypothetical protein [Verrucomicrobiota bacterium]